MPLIIFYTDPVAGIQLIGCFELGGIAIVAAREFAGRVEH